jgi:hypothetical protein
VVEERRGLRFALEALERLAVGAELEGERLEGDVAVQDRVERLVHLAHGPAAELVDDPVLADPLAIHAVICQKCACGQQTMLSRGRRLTGAVLCPL